MKYFTLMDLKLADELCYPEDFERLIEKYSQGTDYEWRLEASSFAAHNSSLYRYLESNSRFCLAGGLGDIMDNIICELLRRNDQ